MVSDNKLALVRMYQTIVKIFLFQPRFRDSIFELCNGQLYFLEYIRNLAFGTTLYIMKCHYDNRNKDLRRNWRIALMCQQFA